MWFVYILECQHQKLYTGITNDIDRRFKAHQDGKGGNFTRAFKVERIVYVEKQETRSAALKREAEIKKWPREKKQKLICRGGF